MAAKPQAFDAQAWLKEEQSNVLKKLKPRPAPPPPPPPSDDAVLTEAVRVPRAVRSRVASPGVDDKSILQDIRRLVSDELEPWIGKPVEAGLGLAESGFYQAGRLGGAALMGSAALTEFITELPSDALNVAKAALFKDVDLPETYGVVEKTRPYVRAAVGAAVGRGSIADPRAVARDYAERVTEKIKASPGGIVHTSRMPELKKEAKRETLDYFSL